MVQAKTPVVPDPSKQRRADFAVLAESLEALTKLEDDAYRTVREAETVLADMRVRIPAISGRFGYVCSGGTWGFAMALDGEWVGVEQLPLPQRLELAKEVDKLVHLLATTAAELVKASK